MTSFSKFLNETSRAFYHIHSPGKPTCCLYLNCLFPNTGLSKSHAQSSGRRPLQCTVGKASCPVSFPVEPSLLSLFCLYVSSPSMSPHFSHMHPSPHIIKQSETEWPLIFLISYFQSQVNSVRTGCFPLLWTALGLPEFT